MTKGQTVDLILEAGAALIARAGPEGASVRAIADRAGVAAPTLQHHFRSKASLLEAIYSGAVEQHGALTQAALAPFSEPVFSGEQGVARRKVALEMAAALIREWLRDGEAAQASAVILHLLVHAVRDPACSDLARQWLSATAKAIRQQGLLDADEAQFLVELLVGLALVSAPGRFHRESDVLNREVLGLVWGVPEGADGYWLGRFRALHETRGQTPQALAETGGVQPDILEAGVTLTAETGADALSYRKIAARANVAPSSVLYHYPDQRALLTALYREVHRRFVAAAPPGQAAEWGGRLEAGGSAHIVELFTAMIVEQMAGDAPLFLASCELFLAGWREPELAPEALFMRLERGRFQWPSHVPDAEALRSHLHSLWSMGLALTQFSRPSADRAGEIEQRLRAGMRVLDR